ncbi:MAG: TonB-dependent receptor [Acidobacteriota bacterium]|nr:TonB-dependent receptor [Acidobacteriota bacterium]
MLNNFRFISVALTIVLAFSAVAFGQGRTGTIEGTVSDQTGAVIPGATVTIESTGTTTGFSRTVQTDGNGYYIVEVAPGTYKLTAANTGFKSSTRSVSVSVDRASGGSFSLEPGIETTIVDVSSDSAVIVDLGDTKIDTNITKDVIEALPKGTTFGSLLKIAPNVRPEALGAGFQIDGASGAENVFVIDGQEVTNFRTGQLNSNNNLPFELLQEVQIKSTGFEAEYGGATGGVINAVTAGGNDQWHGNFGASFQPAGLQSGFNKVLNRYGSAPGAFDYFQPPKFGGTAFFPVASISGPIVKGKLWGLATYAPQIFDNIQRIDYYNTDAPSRQIVNSLEYQQNQRTEQMFTRLDAQPTGRLRMFGTFLFNPIIREGNLPGITEGLAGVPQQNLSGSLVGPNYLSTLGGRQNSNAVNGQANYTLTDNIILNFRGGRSFLNEKLSSYGLQPRTRYLCSTSGNPSAVPGSGCSAGFNTGSNFITDFDVSTRTTFDADASFVGVNAGGRHNIKFGYQYNRLFNDVREGYKDTGYVVLYYGITIQQLGIPVAVDPTAVGAGLFQRFATLGSAKSTNKALYVQDSWRATDRLTFNVGVRIENEIVPSFGAAQTTENIVFGWGDKIAPRFGVAFDLTGDGKTKLFGSYGWFYDRFKYELPRGSFGGDFFRRDYFQITPARGVHYSSYNINNITGGAPDPIGGTCPIVGGPGYSQCQFDFRIATNSTTADIFSTGAVDPDLKAARQSEYTIGLERELGSNMVFAARYTHKQIDRAVEDVGVFNDQGSEAYIIGNPGLGLVCQIASSGNYPCTKAERDYDAVELRVDKRSNKYFYNFSYTWSRLFGNYSGLASSDEFGRSSPNVNRFFDLPMLGYNADGVPDNGPLATDRPHVVKAYGGYNFDWSDDGTNRTSITGFTTFQSGSPVTTIYSLYNVSTAILNGRGDLGRTEMFSESDLQISHTYKFGRENRFELIPFIDIRNLFDERNEIARQTTFATTNFTASTLRSGGCTTCGTSSQSGSAQETAVFQTIFNGSGISQFVNNYLNNVSPASKRNDFNQSNSFQTSRDVRFGFKFRF